MKRRVMFVVALILAATPAFAQTSGPANGSGLWRNVSFAPQSKPPQSEGVRRGFTILVNLGLGIQHDESFQETAIGLGGINVGIGGFVSNNLAVLGRLSETTVTYDLSGQQGSGVVGASVQYWFSNVFHIEAGGGIGFWTWDFDSEGGVGLIFGAGATVFERGHHNLQVGVEYAPVFTESANVHNFCVTFGYQFHK